MRPGRCHRPGFQIGFVNKNQGRNFSTCLFLGAGFSTFEESHFPINSAEKNIKGRGAQHEVKNRFLSQSYEPNQDYADFNLHEAEQEVKTTYTEIFPKTIVNAVKSPDIKLDWSMNPYQGCEHGCVYCYARTTHEYWGLGVGLDFERKIFYKKNAAALLRKTFDSKSWKPAAIMTSGNTDCYQPIERKLKLTRSLLEVCLDYKNPIGLITKNSLIERDLDLLKELAKDNLVMVVISLTSLDEELRSKLEPRTSTAKNKLKTIALLHAHNIPVQILMGPVIPGLNSHEIPAILEAAANAGADWGSYTMVRLNGAIGEIFERWVETTFPDRAQKVLNQIREVNGGALGNTIAGNRMSGNGNVAEIIHQLFCVHRAKFMTYKEHPLNTSLFKRPNDQLTLF
ncbi:MAG: PA0069 family radical SAM protein [Bacteroidetes bacterium]|nr:PA0069 family radical SAM protein [Bacteroidota bacterium]